MKRPLLLLCILISFSAFGQEKDEKDLSQFSNFLSKTYYNFNLGAVFYPFSDANLATGYTAESKKKSPFSGRFLFGYKIKEDLAIQFGVMRPASWFKFQNINGSEREHSVWINLWSLSLKKNFSLSDRLDAYAELGIGNITRVGIGIDDVEVYEDAHYATLVASAGLQYQLNQNWDLLLSGLYLPESKKHNQPYTFQITAGGLYNLSPPFESKKEKDEEEAEYFFPRRTIQLGYATSEFGFFLNKFFSTNVKVGNFDSFGIPIFWLGDVQARNTVHLAYQQTAYHGRKTFSLEWGVSLTGFDTVATGSTVFAVSIYPLMRFFLLRKKPFDFYLMYSFIGPTYISKKDIDGLGTGPHLTYQDFMGFGFYFGKKRNINLDFRIMHYSNGNLFTDNAGVAVPLVFSIGTNL